MEYIYSKKKIPATLLKEVAQPKTSAVFPTSLLPMESTCMVCNEDTALEKLVLMTRKAKILTMIIVIDGKFNNCYINKNRIRTELRKAFT